MPCENNARKRSKTIAFRCTPEEHKLICEMAAWSGMDRQDCIISKLTDSQVEGEALRKRSEGAEGLDGGILVKEVRLAAFYGKLGDSPQQRIEHMMRFFLALGEPVDALPDGMSHMGVPPTTNESIEGKTDDEQVSLS